MSLFISKLYLDELQNDINRIGNYYDNFYNPQNLGSRGLNPNQSSSRGLWSKMFIPVKRGSGYGSTNGDFWRQMEKTYAMLDPFKEYDNPNKSSLRGLWMLYRNPVKRGRGFYDSAKRDFGGATFDKGFELSDWNYYSNLRTKRRKLRMLSQILWRPLAFYHIHNHELFFRVFHNIFW